MKKIARFLVIFWVSFFTLTFFMEATRHVYLEGPRIKGTPKNVIVFLSTFISNVVYFGGVTKPMIVRDTFSLTNGFNYTANYITSRDYLLVSSWDKTLEQPLVKLVRISDGKVLHKWAPDIRKLNEEYNSMTIYGIRNRQTKNSTGLAHPYLLNDGSLIFGNGGIYKIDRNSNIIWSNLTSSHHSIEPGPDGNFWICSYSSKGRNSEKYQIRDDAIAQISSEDGRVLFEKSVFDILMENGYDRGRFFINPQTTFESSYLDYIHLNDVQPVFEDSRYWKKGDLFISLRQQNMVFLYRPTTNKIIWSQNGPWLRQHDVDIIDSAHIGVFGNNVINARFPTEKDKFVDGHNNQYIYDFSRNICYTPYDELFKSSNIATLTGGLSRILPTGDIFIEETNNGRILYGSSTKVKWSYVERIDNHKVSMLSWSRYITEVEFKKYTFLDQNSK
jgi:hypothetical protein